MIADHRTEEGSSYFDHGLAADQMCPRTHRHSSATGVFNLFGRTQEFSQVLELTGAIRVREDGVLASNVPHAMRHSTSFAPVF